MHTPDTLGALSTPSMFMVGVAWSGAMCVSTVVCGGAVDLHHAFVGSGNVCSHILQVNSAMRSKTTSFTFIMSHKLPDCLQLQNTAECNVIDCDCM